jgi:hypothetical protein
VVYTQPGYEPVAEKQQLGFLPIFYYKVDFKIGFKIQPRINLFFRNVIEEMKKNNTGSVIGYRRDDDNCIADIYIFPGFMNVSLSFVRPVVSLDAAHLKSVHKGTLYVASVLSGANEVYPIGFMISSGNEDCETWTRMLGHLREACPILSEQGFLDETIQAEEDRHQFVFSCQIVTRV